MTTASEWMLAVMSCALLLASRCSSPQTAGPEHASTDTRERLRLPAAHRDKILLEMRLMLEAMDRVLQALGQDDVAAAGKAARGAGMAMAVDVEPEIQKVLPKNFLDLGMRTHQAFDALDDRLEAGGSKDDAIQGLAGLTGNCVGCHASYRLDESP